MYYVDGFSWHSELARGDTVENFSVNYETFV